MLEISGPPIAESRKSWTEITVGLLRGAASLLPISHGSDDRARYVPSVERRRDRGPPKGLTLF